MRSERVSKSAKISELKYNFDKKKYLEEVKKRKGVSLKGEPECD